MQSRAGAGLAPDCGCGGHTFALGVIYSVTIAKLNTKGSAMDASLLDRITIEPGKCGGRPCIRGMRIRVNDILEMLGEGVSMEEILADFPDLEREDILASLQFAARRTDIVRLAA